MKKCCIWFLRHLIFTYQFSIHHGAGGRWMLKHMDQLSREFWLTNCLSIRLFRFSLRCILLHMTKAKKIRYAVWRIFTWLKIFSGDSTSLERIIRNNFIGCRCYQKIWYTQQWTITGQFGRLLWDTSCIILWIQRIRKEKRPNFVRIDMRTSYLLSLSWSRRQEKSRNN